MRKFHEDVLAESLTATGSGWKKRLDQKDWKNDFKIILHTRKMENSKNDLSRCEVWYRGIDLNDLL